MGIFFYTNSVALVEDVPLNETYRNEGELIRDMEKGYEQACPSSSILLFKLHNYLLN